MQQTLSLTAGIDAPVGTAGNDTFNATAATLTALDVINGGAGTDTLSIVDTADAMGAAPANVTLTSIENVSISTTGNLGVVAGDAVAQVNKVTLAAVTADVTGSKQVKFAVVAGGTDGTQQMTYNGNQTSFAHDVDSAANTAVNFIAAVNATAGKTVAYQGGTFAVNDAADTADASVTVDTITGGVPRVGMSVTGTDIPAGTYISAVTLTDGVVTGITLNNASADVLADNATLTFGGGTGSATLYGENSGEAAKAVSFGTSTESVVAVAQTLIVTNVAGNEGDVVTFTYAGQTGQYTIGATNDATATAFAAAFNAVASDATAAVVAGNGDTDYVTLTADTAGTALGSLVFTNAGANTPTVTTTTANSGTAATAAAYDASGLTADKVSVVMADSANLKAAATSDVSVSGVTGAITVDGGKSVTVVDATADKAISLSNAKGSVTVTDTKQGTAAITINDATDVTVTAGGRDNNTSTITIGDAADVITGAVVVNATGKAYVAGASETFGAVTIQGGTTVNVNLAATSDAAKIAKDGAAGTHTFGTTTVNAEDGTTEITIVQDAAVAAVNYEAAVAAKAATQKLTFTAAAAGDTVTITFAQNDTLTFTAAKALTAAEVAAAFANLAKDATQGAASATNGIYTSAGTIDTGWSSGEVTTNADATEAYVTFSTATASPTALTAAAGNGNTVTVTAAAKVDGATANQAVTGRIGVANGAVDINGATTAANDAVTTVTLTNFASANIDSDVLTTVNAAGTAGAMVIDSENTGTFTANVSKFASGSQVSLATATKFTTLTLNVGEGKFVGDIVASDVTALTINASSDVTSENATDIDAVKTLTVTGAGKVDLSTVNAGLAGTATAINASANSGGVTLTYGSDTGTFTGGTGADVVTTDSATVSKAVNLGDGDDTFKMADAAGATVSAALDGGDGKDTIYMTSQQAAALDANTVFASAISNFEVLSLGALANGADIVAKNLGLNSDVIVAGTAGNGSATISKLAANANVEITATMGSGALTLALDVATGTSDVINLSTNVDGNLTVGKVVVANVETVNLSAVDKFVDVTGAKDEFDGNIADGKDDTNSVQSISLDIDEATTLNITGSADLTVDILDTNNNGADIKTTLVDASTFTGKLTLIADGKTTGTTVKGGSGDDTLTADGDNDVLIGGAGNDKLVATTLSTLTGGEGKDTFVIGAAGSTNYSTITDLSAGDVIDVALGVANGALTEGATFTAAKVTLAANATFAQYLDAAAAGTADAEANAVAVDEVLVRWFQFGGDTFVVTDREENGGEDAGFGAADMVIGITGLVDLSTATFNTTTGLLTIA